MPPPLAWTAAAKHTGCMAFTSFPQFRRLPIPRSRCQQIRFLVRDRFLTCRQLHPIVCSIWPFFRACSQRSSMQHLEQPTGLYLTSQYHYVVGGVGSCMHFGGYKHLVKNIILPVLLRGGALLYKEILLVCCASCFVSGVC